MQDFFHQPYDLLNHQSTPEKSVSRSFAGWLTIANLMWNIFMGIYVGATPPMAATHPQDIAGLTKVLIRYLTGKQAKSETIQKIMIPMCKSSLSTPLKTKKHTLMQPSKSSNPQNPSPFKKNNSLSTHLSHQNKTSWHSMKYWFFHSDLYSGSDLISHDWVGFHPLP